MELSSLFSGAIIGALITAVIGALLTGYFNIKTKDKEYRNSYSKMILEKRLYAYEELNSLINSLYTSALDGDDSKAYHIIFHSEDRFKNFLKDVYSITFIKFWLSDRTNNYLQKLFTEFQMCLDLIDNGENVIFIGKKEYKFIGEIRDNLEQSLLNDMKELYKIDKFFNEKEIETVFKETNLSERPKL